MKNRPEDRVQEKAAELRLVAEFRAYGFAARIIKPYKLEELLALASRFERPGRSHDKAA